MHGIGSVGVVLKSVHLVLLSVWFPLVSDKKKKRRESKGAQEGGRLKSLYFLMD